MFVAVEAYAPEAATRFARESIRPLTPHTV